MKVVTNATGSVISSSTSKPFGDGETAVFGQKEEFRFTGKGKNESAGLFYFNARFYDPDLGRFIQKDPAEDGDNWYVYCRNNPLKYVDPDGKVAFVIPMVLAVPEISTAIAVGAGVFTGVVIGTNKKFKNWFANKYLNDSNTESKTKKNQVIRLKAVTRIQKILQFLMLNIQVMILLNLRVRIGNGAVKVILVLARGVGIIQKQKSHFIQT